MSAFWKSPLCKSRVFGLSSKEMGYEAVRENQGQVTD